MKKTRVEITVVLLIQSEDETDIHEVLDNMDYEFTANGDDAVILDYYIADYEMGWEEE